MKIIITGASGFIGKYLLPRLTRNKNISEILSITRNINHLNRQSLNNHKLKILTCDLEKQPLHLIGRYDWLIHLGENIPNNNESSVYKRNRLIANNIVLNLIRKNTVSHMLYASTLDVYGAPLYLPVDEDHPTNPLTFYGKSKLANENIFLAAAKQFKVSLVILRLSQVYGFGETPLKETPLKVIPIFLEKIRRRQPIELNSRGAIVRDWVYIKDVVAAIEKTIFSKKTGIFNIATGNGYSLADLIAVLKKYAPRPVAVKNTIRNHYSPPVSKIILDINRARTILGYRPKYDLARGIKEYYEYFF